MRGLLIRGALALCLSLLVALMARAETPRRLIIIDTARMSLTFYEDQREVRRFPIAAGTSDTPSPLGTFRIVSRFAPSEPSGFGTRFLGLNVPWGSFGIHGTNKPGSIGSHASHGCFRMYSRDAEILYRLAPNGTPVIVESGPYGELGTRLTTLRPGDRSAAVRAVQRKLRAIGYSPGNADGVFGAGTEVALRAFLKDRGLAWQDRVDETVYAALGLMLFE
jgi:hypothetical protein